METPNASAPLARRAFILSESRARAAVEYGAGGGPGFGFADIGFGFSPESNIQKNRELPGGNFVRSVEYRYEECGFTCASASEIWNHAAEKCATPARCTCGHLESSHVLGLCRVQAAGERFICGCEAIGKVRPAGWA